MNMPQTSVSNSRALAAFSVGALFFALAFVQRVAPSVMTTELMRDFAVGGAALGTLSGWYFYAYASIQLPVGMLNDRFGPRKLMSVAVAVCALGSFGFALSESVLMASFFRAMVGASVAFAFVGTLTIAGYWFAPARFAMLAGLVQSVGMCGAIIGQAPLRYGVEQFGWRATVGAMGVAAALLAVLLFYVVPRRPRSGEPNAAEQHANHHVDHQANQHDVAQNNAAQNTTQRAGLIAVVTNPQSWACAGIGFGMTAIMLAFAGLWAVPWLSSVHAYPVSVAAGVVSLLFFGWALGAPVMGWLSDHTGKRKPVLLVGIVCNTLIFALLLFGGFSTLPVLAGLFFILGISGSMMTVAFGAMREVNSPRHNATAMGLVNMCVVGSGAVMQPIVGVLLDLGWDGQIVDGARIYSADTYITAFSVLFGSNLLALICILFLRETYCRPLATIADSKSAVK